MNADQRAAAIHAANAAAIRARRFEFEVTATFGEVMRAIVAALADEGLALTDANTPDKVVTVISNGRKVALVPESRIGRARP